MRKITNLLFALIMLCSLTINAQNRYEVKVFVNNTPNVAGMAMDNNGNLWWSNDDLHQINYFDGSKSNWVLGGTTSGDVNGQGKSSRFSMPGQLLYGEVGGNSVVIILDRSNGKVKLANITNLTAITVTTFPGATGFSNPQSIALDGSGNLYVADADDYVVYKVTPTGDKSVYAGQVGVSGSANGNATTTATFTRPTGLYMEGNVLYVSDVNKVRKVEGNSVTNVNLQMDSDFHPFMEAFYNLGHLVPFENGWAIVDQCTVRSWENSDGKYITLAGGLSARDCGNNMGMDTLARFADIKSIYSEDGKVVYVASGNQIKSIVNTTPIGKQEIEMGEAITLFPNPAQQEVFIKGLESITGEISITLFDLTGKAVSVQHFHAGSTNTKISLNGLNKGIYLVQIANSDKLTTRKLYVH